MLYSPNQIHFSSITALQPLQEGLDDWNENTDGRGDETEESLQRRVGILHIKRRGKTNLFIGLCSLELVSEGLKLLGVRPSLHKASIFVSNIG